jgi:WD40 repeat protein
MPGKLFLSLVLATELALLAPTAVRAQEGNPPRLDRFGDPLPAGALARLGTLRFHRAECAAYSPDGRTIATADRDEVNLWDAATSKKIRQLPLESRSSFGSLIFSHDGKKLAATSWGGMVVQIWDLDTFKKVTLVQADEGGGVSVDWGNAAAFSSDDKTFFAATHNALFVWDVASGKKIKEFPLRLKNAPIFVRMVAFSEDGKVAAVQGEEKTLYLWDTRTGQVLHESELLGVGETMKFSPDGKTLAVPGKGHWMSLFSVETGKKIRSLHATSRVLSLAFSADSKTLAATSNETTYSSSVDGDQGVQLWDLGNLEAPPTRFPAPGIHSVTFSPDGKTLAWSCHGQTLRFMDRATGKDQHPTESHLGAIRSLVYHPDGKRVLSASDDGTIRIWDATTGESLHVLHGHVGPVLALALFPNGKLLASGGQDGTLRLWDVESGMSRSVLKDEGNSVLTTTFSMDGKRLVSGGYRCIAHFREPATGKILEEFETEYIVSLAFSPDGKTLAILGDRGVGLRLLDLGTSKVKEFPVERGGSSVAYSPDGKILAVACDETLLLLDTATNGVLRRLPGHYNSRGCVVFSPDGRYLASVSDGWGETANRTIRVFEIATGTEIYAFKKELPIFAAAFSPDGSRLAVGGADATALILDLKNLTGKKLRQELTEKELTAHWESLTASDASKAYEARTDLMNAPKSSVPFLAKYVQPAPAMDAKRVQGLINSLDSEEFRERDQANRELEQLNELVREPLRKALAANPSPEMKRSLQALLARLDQYTPAQLRTLRAIEILEGIGTPESFQIIERLTQGNPDGLATTATRAIVERKQKKNNALPEIPKPRETPVVEIPAPGPILTDRDGDPMPAGAIARLGSARWRLVNEPRRIIPTADGKMLAVVNNFSAVELLDAQTGRCIERLKTGMFGFWLDLRMAVALSADGRKIAGPDTSEQIVGVLAVLDRVRAGKAKIDYVRDKDAIPLVPEEVESGGMYSHGTVQYLSAVDFSPDGKTLVGAVRFEWRCSGNMVTRELKETHLVAWDAAAGKEIWKALSPAKEINTVLFSPDGKTLTVVDQTGVGFWDAATGLELRRWESQTPLFSASYSPDRAWLATGGEREVLLWDVATGKVLRRLVLPGKQIKALAFGPDGKLLAAGGEKTIRFWDALTGQTRGDCSEFPNTIEAVAFSSDGKTLFSGHRAENILRRWDVAGRKPLDEMSGPIAPARVLSFSSDGRKILTSSKGEDFYLWEAATGKPCPTPGKDDPRLMSEWLAYSGRSALLRCEEGFGQQFAMLLTGQVGRLDQLPGFLGSSVDGQRLLVQSEKEKMPCLTVLKVRRDGGTEKTKNEVEREFLWKEGAEVSAALSPDGKTVVAAGNDVVCFFDVITGGERRYGHPTDVKPEFLFRKQSVKFSADGSRIALAGGEGKVRIVAVKDGRQIAEFATKSKRLSGLAFSPDGQTLLTTSFNAPVFAWEVATGQLVRRLEPSTYLYSPDNRLLAASSRTLKVFDLYSGRPVRECQTEGSAFGEFAFSPDSKLLALSCSDTTVVVWPTTPSEAKSVKPLDEKNLIQVLEQGNAAEAYEAIGRMIADSERTIPFLERRLKPAAKVDPEPGEKMPSLSAEDVLHLRAIQALERIGTKQARQLLETVRQGAELSPRTRAAREALRRMSEQ